MEHAQQLLFGPFRLDPNTAQLWRGKQEVILRAKPLAVLRYLAEHSGQVVTKAELLKTVWAGTYVSPTVLKVCVREIREALGEEVTAPHYIETVGRLGYRFIAPVTTTPPQGSGIMGQGSGSPSPLTPDPRSPSPILVGREAEVAQLHKWLFKARRGERQVVFVTEEPGIGKTALIETFLQDLASRSQDSPKSTVRSRKSEPIPSSQSLAPRVWLGWGQCVEHYGAGEAYLPALEAVGQVCREVGGQQVLDVLSRYAPTWVVQLPALVPPNEVEGLLRKTAGATRERMLREMAEVIEALTVERPLVLGFEDLHWSDHSTLELLAYIARRRERAWLLVVGTYRPTEVIVSAHPLKGITQELQAHGQCEELRLELLTEGDVAKYVTERFAVKGRGHQKSEAEATSFQQLAQMIHQRTDGNPLFMVNLVEHLVRHGLVVKEEGQWRLQGKGEDLAEDVPESLRQLIARQIERLDKEEQEVLEVASVVGVTFAIAAVVAGSKREADAVEEVCEEVARQGHFIQEGRVEEWPDGTVSGRYAFRHALYQSILYERVGAVRRMRLHRQSGERLEQGYGTRAREVAAELAVHFERGRDYRKAIRYLQQAGQNAIRRSAHQEAITHLIKGLELLNLLPDTPERIQHELAFQTALGPALIVTKGFAAPEVGKTHTRARRMSRRIGETLPLFRVTRGLWVFYLMRAEYQMAQELGEQLLSLAQRVPDSALLLEAHRSLGITLFYLGELASAQVHLEQGIALYDPQQHRFHAFLYGQDPGVVSRTYAVFVLWLLGYPDQALKRSHEALALAQELAHPFSLGWALIASAWLHQYRREGQVAQERTGTAITLATDQGFLLWMAWGTILRGWGLAEQGQKEEGITLIRQGVVAFRATGAEQIVPYSLTLLAEAYGKAGQAETGLSTLAEALTLVEKSGERHYEAELYRLKGTLTLQKFQVSSSKFQVEKGPRSKVQSPRSKILKPKSQILEPQSEAEACFLKAIDIARKQQAKSLELRAVMSLSRLWQHQGKQKEAHKMLVEIYGWFTEGFDTADLQEAKALLDELEGKETIASSHKRRQGVSPKAGVGKKATR